MSTYRPIELASPDPRLHGRRLVLILRGRWLCIPSISPQCRINTVMFEWSGVRVDGVEIWAPSRYVSELMG